MKDLSRNGEEATLNIGTSVTYDCPCKARNKLAVHVQNAGHHGTSAMTEDRDLGIELDVQFMNLDPMR